MIYSHSFLIKTKLPVAKLWDVLSDTSRMNKAMGLPAWEEADLKGSRQVKTKVLGQIQEWIESPWTWIFQKEIRQERIYSRGLMQKQTGVFRITSDGDSHQAEITFSWFGGVFLRWLIGPLSARFLRKKMTAYLQQQEEIYFRNLAAKKKDQIPLTPLRDLTTEDNELVQKIVNEFPERDGRDFLKKLVEYLLAADFMDVHKINPKKVSARLDLHLSDTLELLSFLTSAGYLALTWDVICPHCRGPQVEANKLKYLTAKSECLSCDLEFAMDTERSVEVTFKCLPRLRAVQNIVYCAAEPAKKTHILVSWPAQNFNVSLDLSSGNYGLRTLKGKNNFEIKVSAQAPTTKSVHIDFTKKGTTLAPGLIEFSYSQDQDDYLVIENLSWSDEKFLAKEALGNFHVRSLLNDDLLQTGIKLDIGEQVILFTDIVGSTPFYKSLGDAKAFIAVQNHYEVIEQIIKKNNGVVVKFIGDAVMGSFSIPGDAFKANFEIHEAFKNQAISLRTSYHVGQVLCVNMNVGLDYFGQTVNTAAKIQKWVGAHETAVSEQIWKKISTGEKEKMKIKETKFDDQLEQTVHILLNK